MTLLELSSEYRAAAAALGVRIRALRRALRVSQDAEERWQLHRRILQLQPMRQETNALAELLERYYERGYYHDDRYAIRPRKPEPGPDARAAVPRD